jgi:hypothetical protein
MDFALNEEQVMFQSMFRDFAQQEIAPHARETDEHEALPEGLLEKAAEQELLGAALPEKFDGAELDWVSICLLMAELGRACLSTAAVIASHANLAALTILDAGTDEHRRSYLPSMASGEVIGAFALTEPQAGSDWNAIQTSATLQGDGYILQGVKSWVVNGSIAGLYIVFARAPGGITAFLLPAGVPGLHIGYRERTMGLRGCQIHALYLKGCRVPEADRLGAEGEGLAIAARALPRYQIAIAAAALGVSEAALQEGKQFAVERKQFGVAIATKQAIGNYFADSIVEIETLRHLVLHSAWKMDEGTISPSDLAIVKLHSARVARTVANRMVQVHGGYGFSNEYSVSRIYRDVRALDVMGGTDQLQQATLARNYFQGALVD